MAAANAEAGPWVERWLSAPRFTAYLIAAAGDRRKALALYDWNAMVASAFHHDLAHLEIGLRNAYDHALCAAEPDRPHWVFESERYFPPQPQKAANGRLYDANQTSRKLIADAVRNAGRGSAKGEGAHPPPGKVIAELTFGFWRYLSAKRQHDQLWLPYLHRAFRPGTGRLDVDRPVNHLHNLRNRVAHHEPLFTQNLAERHRDLVTVAGLVSTELAEYIAARSAWPPLAGNVPFRLPTIERRC